MQCNVANFMFVRSLFEEVMLHMGICINLGDGFSWCFFPTDWDV